MSKPTGYKLQLHPAQGQIFQSDKRFRVAVCGRRFGKTTVALANLIQAACKNPNPIPQAFYWYIAPTFSQAKDIAWKMLNEMCDNWHLPGKVNESELTRVINGIPVKLMGAENMPRLKGVALYGVVCDEYASWKNGAIFEEAIMPTLQDTKGWAWIIGTPVGYNFFYELYEYANSGTDPEYAAFHFTSYDNPFLDPTELDKTRSRIAATTFAQEYLAEFTQVSGAIWSDFSRQYHVIPKYQPTNQYPIYASLDFGFALGHATSFLLHEVRPEQIRTFDGFNVYGKDPNEQVQLIESYTKHLNVYGLYCDSARPDLIKLLQTQGFPCLPADKDVELGIAKVAEYMKINPLTNAPLWAICSHLKDAIRQIENYQWEEIRGADTRAKKVPKKEDDDAADGLRYFLYTFTKPNPVSDAQVRSILASRQQEAF